MGIRFQCPNGHKINVKAFLAGKRARCPDCGAKVVVPFESQVTPTLAAMPASAPAATEAATSSAAANGQNGAANGAPATKRPAASPVTAAATAPVVTVATAAPVSAHAPRTAVSPTFNANLAAAAAVVSAPISPAAVAMPAAVISDPIAEAPQAVWYVRPRTGGQYGPAPGEIFRQWIVQRRVTADSLVWRDGWTDWRLAGEVLPQLATRTPPAFAAAPGMAVPVAAANASPEAANAPAARYIRSRRSKSSTIAAICVLGVVAFALVGVLIFILTRQP